MHVVGRWEAWCQSLSFETFPFSNYQPASSYKTSGWLKTSRGNPSLHTIFVSGFCHSELPDPGWFQIACVCCLTVQEVRSPNSRCGQSPAPSGGSRGGKSFLPLPASEGSSLSWLMATSIQPLLPSSSGLLPLCLHVCIIRTIVTELSRVLNAMAPKTLFPSKVTLTVSRVETKTCLSKGHHSTLYTHP